MQAIHELRLLAMEIGKSDRQVDKARAAEVKRLTELVDKQLAQLELREAHLAKILMKLWYISMDQELLIPWKLRMAMKEAGATFKSVAECEAAAERLSNVGNEDAT